MRQQFIPQFIDFCHGNNTCVQMGIVLMKDDFFPCQTEEVKNFKYLECEIAIDIKYNMKLAGEFKVAHSVTTTERSVLE